MSNSQEMKAALLNYIQYFNDKNLAGLLGLYAEEATIEDPYGQSLIKGQEAIAAMYGRALQGTVWLEQVLSPRGSFTNAATISFIVHTGQAKIHVTDVMTFDEAGRFTSMRAYWGPEDQEPEDSEVR